MQILVYILSSQIPILLAVLTLFKPIHRSVKFSLRNIFISKWERCWVRYIIKHALNCSFGFVPELLRSYQLLRALQRSERGKLKFAGFAHEKAGFSLRHLDTFGFCAKIGKSEAVLGSFHEALMSENVALFCVVVCLGLGFFYHFGKKVCDSLSVFVSKFVSFG